MARPASQPDGPARADSRPSVPAAEAPAAPSSRPAQPSPRSSARAPKPNSAAPRGRVSERVRQPSSPGAGAMRSSPPRVNTPKPMLASEALMEDLAPVDPAKREARIWCAVLGVGYLLLAGLPLRTLDASGLEAALPPLTLGAVALFAALTRVSYRQRAVAMVVLGLLSALTGLLGAGATLDATVGGVGWSVARTLTAMTIPAALLFRARYRAYANARVFLGGALLIAAPFVVHEALLLQGDFGVTSAATVGALIVLAASLTGFMGHETTGAGSVLAPTLIGALALEVALRALVEGPTGLGYRLDVGAFTLRFASASGLAALGLFQLFAGRFAADARRIDLHSPSRDDLDEPPPSSGSDWMTGG